MSENDDALPRLLGGRYRLEAKLGSGGMGVVYRATDLTMHRAVAVKLIRGVDGATLDEEVAGRFLREAKNTARVQHENIIEVYDFGRSDAGDMYFVMELLEGEPLSTMLRRDGKIAPAVTVHIARQMCAALHVAHVAGIIHRDLKPANIMLVHRGEDPLYVKVLDFGVAKSYTPDQETQLTHTGMLVGTVEYMAPEQIMGRTVDGRTDLYSLGVVIYRMLTGKAPFRDGGVPALIHAHLNVFPTPMSETTPEISGALDRVVLRCLAKHPEQRFESMEELSRALAAAMEPPTGELMSLEHGAGADDYDHSEQTEIARPDRPAPSRAPRVVLSVPRPSLREAFDDATIKLDRSDRAEPSVPAPRLPQVPDVVDVPGVFNGDQTFVMIREPSATPRECSMCKTLNAPLVQTCAACGVSLGIDDPDAARARAVGPHGVQMPAPQTGPPSSQFAGPPFHAPPMQGAPQVHGQGAQQGYGTVTWQGQPSPPPPGPSLWQRFLIWTGLR